MTAEQPPATDANALIAALNAKFDALAESVKPKPDKSDRQLLEEIGAGLTALPGALAELLKPSTDSTAPPANEGTVVPPVVGKKRKRNPFFPD